MNAMKLENLELKLEDNVVFMKISGEVSKEEMTESLNWFETAAGANDNLNICVDMAKDDFDGLGELRKEFVRVGHVLRTVPDADKCAVVTDSQFLRNSAKVEGAVIPGLEIRAFAADQSTPAETWLKGESLVETAPAKKEIISGTPAEPVKAETEKSAETAEDNPWDNFAAIDLV
jgi:hypothetical protein